MTRINNKSSMEDGELLEAFMKAMDGVWEVERYSVDEDGKLRVHYVSVNDPRIVWAHNPFNELKDTPKIGDRGRLGFVICKVEKES